MSLAVFKNCRPSIQEARRGGSSIISTAHRNKQYNRDYVVYNINICMSRRMSRVASSLLRCCAMIIMMATTPQSRRRSTDFEAVELSEREARGAPGNASDRLRPYMLYRLTLDLMD